jgi:anti-sigma B factor antagonist
VAEAGLTVTHLGSESLVRAWGGCDGTRAWLLRECLQDLVATGQRHVTLDVAELRFTEFTAVGVVVGAIARIRQMGAEVAICPPASGACQVLRRAGLTTDRAVDPGVRAMHDRPSPTDGAGHSIFSRGTSPASGHAGRAP